MKIKDIKSSILITGIYRGVVDKTLDSIMLLENTEIPPTTLDSVFDRIREHSGAEVTIIITTLIKDK